VTVKRRHAIVHGRVQGVFFRDYTRKKAEELGLVGWVRNLPDSTVEAVFEGEMEDIEAMTSWLAQGSPMSRVTGISARDSEPEGEFSDFTIRY